MRPNEVMIGDWLWFTDPDTQETAPVQIEKDDIGYDGVGFWKLFTPIPITAEILTANGFEKKENHSGCHYANYIEHSPVYAEQTIGDFTAMPFPDGSFKMVVFDPPHLVWAGKTANLYKRFGKLDKDWKTELTMGFKECFRVLEPYGVLIFK